MYNRIVRKCKDPFEVSYDEYLVDRMPQIFPGSWGTVIKELRMLFLSRVH